MTSRRVTVQVFPFDAFGSAGTAAGAQLLGDVVREILEDAEIESRRTRQSEFPKLITIHEAEFTTLEHYTDWRTTGLEIAGDNIDRGEFTLWLAGNHLGVLPVYESLQPEDVVIQFDAHLDCYNFHDTETELSHGNFMLHASSRPRVINVGHRDLLMENADIRNYYERVISAEEWLCNPTATLQQLQTFVASASRVWIDIDADVFDPSVCPAVHGPLPFGPSSSAVLQLIAGVWSPNVIGVSISEFDPGRDHKELSLQLFGWLVEWLLVRATVRMKQNNPRPKRGRG
jgi:agmatinase